MTLSEEMVKYRAENNLSQKAAAEKAHITLQTWMYVEKALQNPSRLTESKIRLVIGGDSNEG